MLNDPFSLQNSQVQKRDFECRPVTCNDGEELIQHPSRCCPVCGKSVSQKMNGACVYIRSLVCQSEGTFDEVECTVANWGEWGDCSRTCGGGRQVRVREITFPEGGDTVFCNETLTQLQDCNTEGCPGMLLVNYVSMIEIIGEMNFSCITCYFFSNTHALGHTLSVLLPFPSCIST